MHGDFTSIPKREGGKMINNMTFKIKKPAGIQIIVSVSLLTVIQLLSIRSNILNESYTYLFYIACILLIFCLIMLVLTIRIILIRPSEMLINTDSIRIEGKTIEAKQIKAVMIMGYFKPVIGIKPIENKIVPMDLCFKFLEDEDQGIKEITRWAEQNQIKVSYKHFWRWI